MRQIEIEEGLRVRFPARGEEFDQGVEIGIAAVLMTAIGGEFSRTASTESVPQLRSLAERLGYHLELSPAGDGLTAILFKTGRSRPKLALVHSAPATAGLAVAPRETGRSAHRSAPTLVRRIDEAVVS